jgi:PilZ domain
MLNNVSDIRLSLAGHIDSDELSRIDSNESKVTLTIEKAPRFEKQKRRDTRRTIRLEGVVRHPNGQITACEVRDVSKGGALLLLSIVDMLPEEFILEIPGNTKVVRRCRRMRQDGTSVGVRFVE